MSDIPSEPADGGRDAEGAPPASEAEWEAFQREAEQSVRRPSKAGPVPKEPSARARMVAARFREQDEAAARSAKGGRFGRKRKQPEPWQPEGWRTGPAWQQMQGGRRGRWPRTRRVGAVFGALAVLAAGLWFADDRGYVDLDALGSGASDARPLAAETARPTGAPPTGLRHDVPTPERPWAGSPARRWAGGADAIELPEARRTGKVPAADVAEALKLTKEFLVASGLDREVLHGARPDRAVGLLDPENEDFLHTVREGLRNPTAKNDSALLFTRFDGDEVRLVGDTVKVRGRMMVREGSQGRAVIEADYTFVYPVRHAAGGEEVTRVLVRRAYTVDVAPPGWKPTPGKIWIRDLAAESAGVLCAAENDGLFHPDFPSERTREDREGPTRDPYDRSREPGSGGSPDTCGTASRT